MYTTDINLNKLRNYQYTQYCKYYTYYNEQIVQLAV